MSNLEHETGEASTLTLEQATAIIEDQLKPECMMISMCGRQFGPSPEFGAFVMTGWCVGGGRNVGYITQIRQGAGIAGSDMVFLRLSDGSLMTSENQSYWLLDVESVRLLMPHFETLPSEELADNPELRYLCCNKIEAKGFIVPKGAVPESREVLTFGVSVRSGGDE